MKNLKNKNRILFVLLSIVTVILFYHLITFPSQVVYHACMENIQNDINNAEEVCKLRAKEYRKSD